MTVSAINTFRLRPGVTTAEFEQFSVELDRPICLGFDVVRAFDVYLSEDGTVVEIMTVTSWPEWEKVRDGAPELKPVVERFDQLVQPGSVTTVIARCSPLPQEN
ncbi:hypothetical protein [Mycobacterium sp. SMC-4]|uniref:hypothetical protein n=1 Tax=Mycobacterium sp. SMC-4 TaxID=2857059 RepID=UPI0021B20B65|nr:hypothetical protein [Mycobacterium sp. SMC-4]UXA18501.1 hypothetical protein KXD98_01910 [Mycobacterium sp. SMC-4]